MKRRKLIRHERLGCKFLRKGANHTIYYNPANGLQAPVERHTEIKPGLVREICKELGIPAPRER